MNKQELIEHVAKNTSGEAGDALTKGDVQTVVAATLDTIAAALRGGDDVNIAGFGKFEVQHKPARTVKTFGEERQVEAKNVVKFKPAKALKDAVA